jgi:hypothetical protein
MTGKGYNNKYMDNRPQQKFIQFYDKHKTGQMDVYDLAILLSENLQHHISEWGEGNVGFYADKETCETLYELGFPYPTIREVEPCDNSSHAMRWLSILSIQTSPLTYASLNARLNKQDYGRDIVVQFLFPNTDNPILAKYNIEQPPAIAYGEILYIGCPIVARDAYIKARDIIEAENPETQERQYFTDMEVATIMGAYLVLSAIEYKTDIRSFEQ